MAAVDEHGECWREIEVIIRYSSSLKDYEELSLSPSACVLVVVRCVCVAL